MHLSASKRTRNRNQNPPRRTTQNLTRLKSLSLSSIPTPSTCILCQSTSALETSERKIDVAQTEFKDLQARLDTCEARTRLREGNLEDVRAAAEAEHEHPRPAADTRVLESELEHEHATLEEVRKRTTELEDFLVFLKLEVMSSSTLVSDTSVRLEERVRALHYSVSRRWRCTCRCSWRMTGSHGRVIC